MLDSSGPELRHSRAPAARLSATAPQTPRSTPFIRTTFSMAPGQELMISPSSAFWRARVAFEPAVPWPLGLASAMRSECAQQ